MELSVAERTFLEILSDGKKKTYVHIVRGFGMPLTPMAPTFTNKIAKRLLKLGLIETKGRLAPGYRITQMGLAALHQRSTVVQHQPPSQAPTTYCPNCGTAATWIPQYSRHYCYHCKQYV